MLCVCGIRNVRVGGRVMRSGSFFLGSMVFFLEVVRI